MKAKTTGMYLIAALAVAIVVVFIVSPPVVKEIVYPIERAAKYCDRNVWSGIKGMFAGSEAMKENVRLRREIASLSILRGDLERMERENARLRRSLEYTAKAPKIWIAAAVLSNGGASAASEHMIKTDKGLLAGVEEGAVVAVPEGIVGIVTEVTLHTSEIQLISDPRIGIACEVECADEIWPQGVVIGGNKNVLFLHHLMNADRVLPKARVLTSGRGGVFPKGYEIGTIIEVDNNGVSDGGSILPAVDFDALEDVFIRCEK